MKTVMIVMMIVLVMSDICAVCDVNEKGVYSDAKIKGTCSDSPQRCFCKR